MKLSAVIALTPALTALGNTKLPVKASYRVAKAINKLNPDLEAYGKARAELAKRLSTLNDAGTAYEFKGPALAEFNSEHEKLLDEEVEIDLPKISIDELGDVVLEPVHLAALDGVILTE